MRKGRTVKFRSWVVLNRITPCKKETVHGRRVHQVKPHVKESDSKIMKDIIERRKSAFERLSKY